MTEYRCACSFRFALVLGKYGCPNCEGEGVAVEVPVESTMDEVHCAPGSELATLAAIHRLTQEPGSLVQSVSLPTLDAVLEQPRDVTMRHLHRLKALGFIVENAGGLWRVASA